MPGDIGAMGQIDIEMSDALVVFGDPGEGAVDARASGAQLGAELQERRHFADAIRAQAPGLDHFMGDVVTRPALPPLQVDADGDRRRQQEGEAYESAHVGHN
jgi:hypothetical protein